MKLNKIKELLDKHFNAKKEYDDFDSWSFVFAEGMEIQALLYSELFWPDFKDADGMAFNPYFDLTELEYIFRLPSFIYLYSWKYDRLRMIWIKHSSNFGAFTLSFLPAFLCWGLNVYEFDAIKKHYSGDKVKIEKACNLIELAHMFSKYSDKINEDEWNDVLEILSNRIVEMWSAKLKLQFPEREYIVETVNDEMDYGIWFYQRK